MKIIFNNTDFTCAHSAKSAVYSHAVRGRDWNSFMIVGNYADIAAAFVDGAQYRQEWESETTDENGQTMTETMTRDLSEYCIAGDIVDLRDGTFLVYMGKKTETELMQEALDAVILDALMGGDA